MAMGELGFTAPPTPNLPDSLPWGHGQFFLRMKEAEVKESTTQLLQMCLPSQAQQDAHLLEHSSQSSALHHKLHPSIIGPRPHFQTLEAFPDGPH